MKRRRLGSLEVSAIGLGCMSMTPIYGAPSEPEAVATLHRALELGVDLIDTADTYGERLERGAGRPRSQRATRQGGARHEVRQHPPPGGGRAVNGRPDYVPKACEASLRRLGADVLDLYYSTASIRRCRSRTRSAPWRSS